MRKILIFLILVIFIGNGPCFAYWIWTPKSGKWENPKYAAKDTPEEQMEHAKSSYEKGNLKVALIEFRKLIRYYPKAKEAPRAQYYIGRIMEDLDKPYEAFKAYQNVIDKYPYTELIDEVIEREFKIGELFLEGKKVKVLGALGVPAIDKAVEIFKAVSVNAPYGKFGDAATYKTGLAYKKIIDYPSAIKMFKELIDKHPSSEFVDEAKYELAECSRLMSLEPAYDQTSTKSAREEFEDFLKRHPGNEKSSNAEEIIGKLKLKEAQSAYETGKFYESIHAPQSAAVYYRDVIAEYPDTEWAKKSQERLNEIEKK